MKKVKIILMGVVISLVTILSTISILAGVNPNIYMDITGFSENKGSQKIQNQNKSKLVEINPELCCADVNSDGQITIIDTLLIARYYLGILDALNCHPDCPYVCEDEVNILDSLLVARYYVGYAIRPICSTHPPAPTPTPTPDPTPTTTPEPTPTLKPEPTPTLKLRLKPELTPDLTPIPYLSAFDLNSL